MLYECAPSLARTSLVAIINAWHSHSQVLRTLGHGQNSFQDPFMLQTTSIEHNQAPLPFIVFRCDSICINGSVSEWVSQLLSNWHWWNSSSWIKSSYDMPNLGILSNPGILSTPRILLNPGTLSSPRILSNHGILSTPRILSNTGFYIKSLNLIKS